MDFVSVSCLRERRCALFGIARLGCERACNVWAGQSAVAPLAERCTCRAGRISAVSSPSTTQHKKEPVEQVCQTLRRRFFDSAPPPSSPGEFTPEETCPFFDFDSSPKRLRSVRRLLLGKPRRSAEAKKAQRGQRELGVEKTNTRQV